MKKNLSMKEKRKTNYSDLNVTNYYFHNFVKSCGNIETKYIQRLIELICMNRWMNVDEI